MSSIEVRRCCGVVVAAVLTAQVVSGADDARTRIDPGRASTSSTAQRPTTSRTGSAKGPLPDPALLDGSKQPAEKKSEYGMIGDFELPGDENARTGKVGGPQNPGQMPGNGGGMPSGLPMPQTGGAGAQGKQASQPAGSEGGAEQKQGGGAQGQDAAGKPINGAGEAGAPPDGTQVAELGGSPSGEQGGAAGEKPPPVAIGDSAMRIPASQSSAGVVGGQQQIQGNTQHHEKGTGTGGKAPTGIQGNNKVEKGRTIPAGL